MVGVAAGAAFVRLRRVAIIAAAYKAKILASWIFASGRVIDVRRADEVGSDSYWPMRLLHARVDHEERSVTVSLAGLWPRTATYRPGAGATLAAPPDAAGLVEDAPSRALLRQPADGFTGGAAAIQGRAAAAVAPENHGWPMLQRVVASAFAEPDPTRLRRTRAIVVVRDGRVILERYAPNFHAGIRFPGWSMTKSVLSALVGILVGEGRLSLEDQMLLPHWRSPDPRATIRLEDLLRMRSGLKFSEVYSDLTSDVIEMLFNRADAAAYAAAQPLTAAPGTVWSYSSGTTNILSAIVRRAVGEAEYPGWPRRVLFDPLGMTTAIIEPDRSGTFVGSSFMLATAREWARFGQLYLQQGAWEGRQIVPEAWVRFSTSPTPESPQQIYGAHWWLGLQPELGGSTPPARLIPRDAFFALGHEGQTLTVIPSLQLVVVRLGLSIYTDAWNHAAFLASLLEALSSDGAHVDPSGA